jgi:ATP synthase in type III secretion protein N
VTQSTPTTILDRQVLDQFRDRIFQVNPIERIGFVNEIIVSTVKAILPDVMQGELCEIETANGQRVLGEVIAFSENEVTISCLQSVAGVALGAKVVPLGRPHCIKAAAHQFSAVLDGMGRNLDQPEDRRAGVLSTDSDAMPVIQAAPPASQRPPVSEPLVTQIRVIDNLLTLGIGQRIGVFAPPGCGKSTLMAQIVRGANVDAVVFGLVGERGRELREFMEKEITEEIRKKSFFVCATSDRSPIERVRAAFTATSIAEYLRDQGKSVLLVIDSLTRLARAQRELGLMAGEPATQSGFTPSVYSILPELIERSGRTEKGDITAIFTVLMEGERLEDDPIASEAKSLLDGHIVLSNKLVEKAHFPAIDPLKSLSRVMASVTPAKAQTVAALAKRAYSLFQEVELLIRLNEYQQGTDPLVDEAVSMKPKLDEWCKQGRFAPELFANGQQRLAQIVAQFERLLKGGAA